MSEPDLLELSERIISGAMSIDEHHPLQMASNARLQPITDDIAQCALFLASDRGSFINATDIVVDGGLIGGNAYSAHQEVLKQTKVALGIG